MSGPLIAGFLRVGASPRINVLTRLGNAIDIVGPRPTGGSLRIAAMETLRERLPREIKGRFSSLKRHLHILLTRMSLYRDMLS